MRRTLLSLCAIALSMASTNAYADGKSLVDRTEYSLYSYDWQTQSYIKLDEPSLYDYTHYYYNAKGELAIEEPSFCQYRYDYNAEGKKTQRVQWNLSGTLGFIASNTISYEYDADGNLIKEIAKYPTSTQTTVYADFENGVYKTKQAVDGEGNVTSETHYILTFDEAKNLTEKLVAYKDYVSGEYTPSEKYVYAYADNKLVKETYSTLSGEEWLVANSTEYTYDADGDVVETRFMTGSGKNYQERVAKYTYSQMKPAYTPQNVKAEAMPNNRIYVSWDAVEGADSYQVMYDNTLASATTTEFITPTLFDGEHSLTVMAVISGERRNISDYVTATVTDPGRKPMENFQITKVVKQPNDWGYTDYLLDFSWEKPETASPISGYKIYIDNGTYGENPTWLPSVTINDPEATSYQAQFGQSTFQVQGGEEVNWEYLEEGYECKIWIVAVYATGESDKSNIVTMNVFNTNIKSVELDMNQPVEIYSISGVRLGGDLNSLPSHAVYILKQGNSVKKIAK
ncbi:MAG: hypothetical protein NC206_08075 [Bacteroides sp.]|nr:hypothetical protein [Roseburia sp.]MCM1347026.1 hypothetical protein [Bacteroides sp.]MCM1421519.1 hypothetical protein [Bacteroides sp.]